MSNSFGRVVLAATIALALPVAAAAQDAAGHDHAAAEHPAHQQDVQALMSEMQQVHQQLEGVQQQALADPGLSAVQEELGEEIRVAMNTVDPTLEQQLGRISELETQASAAQQSGDMQALQSLMGEAQQIQKHFMSVQGQVLEQPQIATKVAAFQAQLESKMIELDPGAQALITRFRELETALTAAMAGA